MRVLLYLCFFRCDSHSGFISLLVAEVFAIGLKMKEEQDLTI
ncbi:DUF2975 domain-containing protein [Phocaeicola vulgatus]|nr:DUF2975 domain-containing protein [Phocaeicola vulgatus]